MIAYILFCPSPGDANVGLRCQQTSPCAKRLAGRRITMLASCLQVTVLLEEMKKKEVVPDARTYLDLIEGAREARQLTWVVRYLEAMRKEVRSAFGCHSVRDDSHDQGARSGGDVSDVVAAFALDPGPLPGGDEDLRRLQEGTPPVA
jgi:hypothetical protein